MKSRGALGLEGGHPHAHHHVLDDVDGVQEIVAILGREDGDVLPVALRSRAHPLDRVARRLDAEWQAQELRDLGGLDADGHLEVVREGHRPPEGSIVGIQDLDRLDAIAGIGEVAGDDRGGKGDGDQVGAGKLDEELGVADLDRAQVVRVDYGRIGKDVPFGIGQTGDGACKAR